MTETTTATRKRPSRASAAAAKLAAKPTTTIVGGATGASTTGDNGHGFKKPTAARKPAAAKPKPEAAAKPVKVTAAKKETGPTPTEQKRIVANSMAKAVADMLATWDAAKTGVPAEFAAQAAASYLNYAPVTEWDDRLPDRSGAGGRGRKNRASA